MIELGFIFALEALGLVLALSLARAAAAREPGASVYRVVSAVERALRSLFARERGAVLTAAAVALVAAMAVFVLTGRPSLALFVSVGVASGAALTAVTASLGAACTAHAAGATHASSRLGFNASLATALRAGGAVGLGSETASSLGAFTLFALVYFAEGGNARSVASPASLLDPCLVVAGYGLGAAGTALVVGRAGSAYEVGAESGRARGTPDGDGNDPRNPALVAGLVGDHAGPVARGSSMLFALSAVALAATLVAAKGSGGVEPLRFAALPLVMRAFGMVGCAAATLVARADEAQGQGFALVRGLLCAVAIGLFGIIGASYWLAPAGWPYFAGAGALGLAAAALPSLAGLSLTDRHGRPVRDALSALKGGLSAAFGASLGHALARALLPVVGVVALGIGAGVLGERALEGGAALGLVVFALSLLSLAPYALTTLALSSVARSARTTSALSKLDPESAWRLQRLDDVGFRASAMARAGLLAASAFAALPAFGMVALGSGSLAVGYALGAPFALAGALVVLVHAGRSARAASGAADEVALEVRRQLGAAAGAGTVGGASGAPGSPAVPEGFAPSYRACEELTQKAASFGLAAEVAGALALLVPLGICLGLVYRVGGSRLAAAALSTFVATAAVTALGAALAVDGARTVHSGARRLARLEHETAGSAAPIPEEVLANLLGSAAGPAASAQALLVAGFALAVILSLT